jgi:isoaspartyl peptidase/L-asparaginase-like protein (Ntn-hydrolase superfamily)
MEDDETFDAGKGNQSPYIPYLIQGSFLNAIGEIELDAIVMEGKNLAAV